MQWTDSGSGNSVLSADDFYISYQGDAEGKKNPVLSLFNLVGSTLSIETAAKETALCLRHGEPKWRILNGDFRKEYEAAFPDLTACVAVYEKHKAQARSQWSTDE